MITKLAAADGSNNQIDGDDVSSFTAVTPTLRINNRTNISRKVFIIADNLEFVDEAGRASEIAYQTVKAGKELKRDMETILMANVKADGGGTGSARKCCGLSSWLATNSVSNTASAGTAGANPVLTSGKKYCPFH